MSYAKKRQQIISSSFPRVVGFMESIPDFYLEMDVKVKSFIPLVSNFTPGDTIRVWKKGKQLRMDYTLVGYEFLSCKRREMSCIFNG